MGVTEILRKGHNHMTDADILKATRQLAAESELIWRCASTLLAKLDDFGAGYPSGGSTSPSSGTEPVDMTIDEAKRTRDRYIKAIAAAERAMAEPLAITKHTLEGWIVEPTKDAAPTNDIWCANHIQYGMKEPRWQRNLVCRWCYDIKADRDDYPNKALCDLHSIKPRITVADLDRLMPKVVPITKNKGGKKRGKKAA